MLHPSAEQPETDSRKRPRQPKPRPRDEKPQFERFLEAVREVTAAETDEELERAMEKHAPPRRPKPATDKPSD